MNRTIPSGQSGFTLLEVLIAISILTIGLLAVGKMQISAIKGNFMSVNTTTALMLAEEKMEDLLGRSYTDSELSDATSSNNSDLTNLTTVDHEENVEPDGDVISGGFYRRIWNVADPGTGNAEVKRVCVIVSWEDNRHRVFITSIKPL